MHLPFLSHEQDMTQGYFLVEFNKFELRVILLLAMFLKQNKRSDS